MEQLVFFQKKNMYIGFFLNFISKDIWGMQSNS